MATSLSKDKVYKIYLTEKVEEKRSRVRKKEKYLDSVHKLLNYLCNIGPECGESADDWQCSWS